MTVIVPHISVPHIMPHIVPHISVPHIVEPMPHFTTRTTEPMTHYNRGVNEEPYTHFNTFPFFFHTQSHTTQDDSQQQSNPADDTPFVIGIIILVALVVGVLWAIK